MSELEPLCSMCLNEHKIETRADLTCSGIGYCQTHYDYCLSPAGIAELDALLKETFGE